MKGGTRVQKARKKQVKYGAAKDREGSERESQSLCTREGISTYKEEWRRRKEKKV